jgi:hypothetical protein
MPFAPRTDRDRLETRAVQALEERRSAPGRHRDGIPRPGELAGEVERLDLPAAPLGPEVDHEDPHRRIV